MSKLPSISYSDKVKRLFTVKLLWLTDTRIFCVFISHLQKLQIGK